MTDKKLVAEKINETLFSKKTLSGTATTRTIRLLKGKPYKFLTSVGRTIVYTSARSFGWFFLAFGVLTLFLYLGEYYFVGDKHLGTNTLFLGGTLIIIALPLLAKDKPLCLLLSDWAVTDYILFEFFAIKRMHEIERQPMIKPTMAIFLGFVPAIFGFFFSVDLVILIMLVTVLIALSMTSPEFPMLLTVIILPYLSFMQSSAEILITLSVLSFLSFILKAVVGKRVYNFDVYDFLAFLLVAAVALGGIISGADDITLSVLLVLGAIFMYANASNMIINRRLADKAVQAIIVSSVPLTLVLLLSSVLNMFEITSSDFVTELNKIVFFESTYTQNAFIATSLVLSFSFFMEKKNPAKKTAYLLISFLHLSLITINLEFELLISLLVALLAYYIITSTRVAADFLLLLCMSPMLLFLLPEGAFNSLLSFIGTDLTQKEIFVSFEKMFEKLFDSGAFFGLGLDYNGLVETVNNGIKFNTPLGVMYHIGIFGFVVVTLFIVIRFRHISYYKSYVSVSLVKTVSDMSSVALVALLVYGMSKYLFYDLRGVYILLFILGINTAALRTARAEHDDRLGYYGDASSSVSSVIDINLKK